MATAGDEVDNTNLYQVGHEDGDKNKEPMKVFEAWLVESNREVGGFHERGCFKNGKREGKGMHPYLLARHVGVALCPAA